MWGGSFKGSLQIATLAHLFKNIEYLFVVEMLHPLWINDIHVCKQASVFVQSHVRAHVELMWLLSSITPIGWLNRMIQFKEKSRKAVRLLLYAFLISIFNLFIIFPVLWI